MSATNEITAAEYQEMVWKSLTEATFQNQVINEAKRCGWTHIYHTRFSIGSKKGYPDLHLVRGTRSLFLELKKMSAKPPTLEQESWLEALRVAGHEAHWFRPSDMREIERLLS